MDPTTLTSTTSPSALATAQQTASPQGVISSDFETFLKMLTVQMENQDPLNPIESTEFATQLATFSSVEQQVLTNDLLESMIGQLGATGMAQMAGWVGRDVRAVRPAWFDGDPITLAPTTARAADRAEIVVRDALGTLVDRFDIPLGSESTQWSGVDWSGTTRPEGAYRFTTVSYQGDDVLEEAPTEVYGHVLEVRLDDGATVLVFDGGQSVSAANVTALRAADSL